MGTKVNDFIFRTNLSDLNFYDFWQLIPPFLKASHNHKN